MSKRPNGTGGVTKAENGTWTASWTVGYNIEGKRVRRTKRGFASKRDAMQYVESMKYEKPSATIEALWQTYLATGYNDLTSAKQRHYLTVYERIMPVHNRNIDSLTIMDLQGLIQPYSEYYAQKDIRTILSHMYNIAIAQGMAQVNLAQYMHLTNHVEKKGKIWSPSELDLFWERYHGGDSFVGYILFMSYTGAMPGELWNIYRNMIDYEAHEIRGAGLKTEVRRDSPIILSDKIIPVLKDLMADKLILWPHSKQAFYDEYHRCLKRCGIEYKEPYTCRHTAATMFANETNPLLAQKLMRHAQVTTTQRYVHPSSEQLLSVANKL